MSQALQDPALVVKTPEDSFRIHTAFDQLDSDYFTRLDVPAAVHHSHAAGPNALGDLIVTQAPAEVRICRWCV
jgi:hypothetical protein